LKKFLDKFLKKEEKYNLKRQKEKIVVTKLPKNKKYDQLKKYFFTKRQKAFILILLKYTEKSGASLRTGIINKIKEARNKKNVLIEYILMRVLYYMDIEGYKIVDAMFAGGLINQKEKSILQKSRTFSQGINQITNLDKRKSKLVIYNLMLFGPFYIALVVLLATHSTVKNVLMSMVKPIVDAGGKAPPLPHYMQDPSLYIFYNVAFFTLLFGVLGFYYYCKYYNLPLYFKVFILNEQEKVLEILENLSSLLNSGINMTDSVKILLDDEKDIVKKKLYSEIYKNFIKGNIELSQIFEYYNVDYSTIGLISTGENTHNITETLKNAKDSLEESYNLYMKIYGKIAFTGGQLLMGVVIIKPIIDILLYTSIQQLNFST